MDTGWVSVKWHGCPKRQFGLEQHGGSGWHSRPLEYCGCINESHRRQWIYGPSGRYSGPLLHCDRVGGSYTGGTAAVVQLWISVALWSVVCALDFCCTKFSMTGATEISGTVVIVIPTPNLSSTLVPVVCTGSQRHACHIVPTFRPQRHHGSGDGCSESQ